MSTAIFNLVPHMYCLRNATCWKQINPSNLIDPVRWGSIVKYVISEHMLQIKFMHNSCKIALKWILLSTSDVQKLPSFRKPKWVVQMGQPWTKTYQ